MYKIKTFRKQERKLLEIKNDSKIKNLEEVKDKIQKISRKENKKARDTK